MKQAITHENFNAAIDRCRNGLSNIIVSTYGRTILIKSKHLQQWDNAGKPLLIKDSKSEGFYIRRGKGQDYIFPANIQPILFEVNSIQ